MIPDAAAAIESLAAKSPEKLHIFAFSPENDPDETVSVLRDYTACHNILFSAGETAIFPCGFSFESCNPRFRTLRELSGDTDTSALISALRGKGLPISTATDREAVEWCFSDLLSRPQDPSILPFFDWLERNLPEDTDDPRITLTADLTDPFSAGVALVLLHSLRSLIHSPSVHLSLIGLADPASASSDVFFRSFHDTLLSLERCSLIRNTESGPSEGADAAWIVSIPSSMHESEDVFHLVSLVAARIIGAVHGTDKLPSPGLHTLETDGTLSLSALRGEALPFAAFLRFSVWMLSDVIPSLRSFLSHPARLRSLTPGPRNTMFRQMFGAVKDREALSVETDLVEKVLQDIIRRILLFMRSVPSSMRLSSENAALWQNAVNACGRYITVASEYEVSFAEAHDSGLDTVRPVHRASMADTDEEQLIRRLQDMLTQRENEKKSRDSILSSLGGYRALQVRRDCLERCMSAQKDAERKLSESKDIQNHLSLLKLKRRVLLLKAAVRICEEELNPLSVRNFVSARPNQSCETGDPYAGIVLTSEACRLLETLVDTPENASSVHISVIFPDIAEPDSKSLFKSLHTLCQEASPDRPFPYLAARFFDVCRKETEGCRFLSRGVMPALPLMPDLLPAVPVAAVRDLLALLPENTSSENDAAALRGLLAMLLLRQYRRRSSDEASVRIDSLEGHASPVLRYWLSVHHTDIVHIVSLEKDDELFPFLLVLPGQQIIPARRTEAQTKLVPSFVTWFDTDLSGFTDPCGRIGEGDRKLLSELLESCVSALESRSESSLSLFLRDFQLDLSRPRAPYAKDKSLLTRLRAVCALRSVSAYESSLSAVSCFYEHNLPSDCLLSCITGRESFPASPCLDIPEEVLYLYRDIPFARDDSMLLLDSTHASGEEYILKRLDEECAMLSAYSDDYRDALVKNLRFLLEKRPGALPEVREAAEKLLRDASEPVENREPAFTWPWDIKSPSIMTVLRESLGAELAASAVNPFSDCLAIFPARGKDVIGDTLFSSMCTIHPREHADTENSDIASDALLPPFSPDFARSLCGCPEGRTLLQPDLLHFEYMQEDALCVIITLDGQFPVRLIRSYSPDEIIYLYSHDIPTVALWPSVPFRPEDWSAYFVYAHIKDPYTLSVLPENGDYSTVSPAGEDRCAGMFAGFPVCFALFRDDKCIGTVLNILPDPLIAESDPAEICTDFGSASTSVVFSSSGKRRPMQGPVAVRTLINNPASSRELLRREFLPAVPVSALLPTVSRIFRNIPGASPEPFLDGIVLMSSDMEDLLSTPSDAIYTSLKWEEEKGRSGFLCLHQILLMAALQARMEGAPSLSWRFSLPDEMAKEGRESLMNLFLNLCDRVHRESGYAIPPEGIPVAFASESSALGAYFRYCAPDETRGGFMVLDLGACTADISLFMRGREQAVRTCQIPLGIHYIFLPALLREPDLPAREFGFCTDETFRRDLGLLCKALRAARTDAVALRRARIALDYFISDHFPLLMNCAFQLSAAGMPSRLGALMLLYFSYMMMLSGLVLLQLASDSSRNDFLPDQMTLCISGRGSQLMESLPPAVKNALWQFLTIFRNRKVSSVSLLFSSEKKLEIPVGLSMLQEVFHMLPPASSVPSSIAVRPAALLPEFLLLFRSQFPASAELLFPGFFTEDYYHPFSAQGESIVSNCIDQSFPPTDIPRPYDALAAWIGNLLDSIA